MRLETQWLVGDWLDITLYTDNARLQLGLYNAKERKILADHLREVIDELEEHS
jgi:hypothetical protein